MGENALDSDARFARWVEIVHFFAARNTPEIARSAVLTDKDYIAARPLAHVLPEFVVIEVGVAIVTSC